MYRWFFSKKHLSAVKITEYNLNIYSLILKPVTFPYTVYHIPNCSDNDSYSCNKRIIWANYLSLWHLGDWCVIYVLGILEYGSIFIWYSSQYPLRQLLPHTLASQNSPLKKITEICSMKYRHSFVVLCMWRGVFNIFRGPFEECFFHCNSNLIEISFCPIQVVEEASFWNFVHGMTAKLHIV